MTRTDYAPTRGVFNTVFTSAPFTPPDNSLVTVWAVGMLNGGTTNPASTMTIANSAGLSFSAPLLTAGTARDFGNGARAWGAVVVLGEAMTVTITSADTVQYCDIIVMAHTGYDTGTPYGQVLATNGGPSDGVWAPTFGAPPLSTSEIIALAHATMDVGTGSMVQGTGWAELYELIVIDWYVAEMQVRAPGSASDVVLWDDTRAGGAYYYGPLGAALEIRAAGAAATSLPPIPPGPSMGVRQQF